MNKVPTAHWFLIEFMVKNKIQLIEDFSVDQICEYGKKLSKLHVEQALKNAYENAEFTTDSGVTMKFSKGFGDLDKESILNSYPLINIQ